MAKQFKTMEELEPAMLRVMEKMQEEFGLDEDEADYLFGRLEGFVHEMCGAPKYES